MNVTPRPWWAPTHYAAARALRRARRRAGARLMGLDFGECAWIVGMKVGAQVPESIVTAGGQLVPVVRRGELVRAARNVVLLDVR